MKNVSSINSLEKNVPRLRFPGFEGEWETVKLSDFVERVTRKNTNSQSDLPLTISSKDGLVDQISYFSKTVASKDMSGYYLLLNGEFAYNKSYSVGYDYGSIKRLDRYPMGALSTLYICFALKKYDSDFIKIYFDSLKWYREIYMIAAEGARNHGLLNIPTDEFFKTRHTLPMNIEEQKKIASFLTLLDERISKQRELVESLKSYKRGLLLSLFPQNGESIPRLRFKGFGSQWNRVKIGDVGSVSMCKRVFKEQTSSKGDVPFYKIGTFGGIADSYISRELFDNYKSKYPYPQKGDILISASGSIGRIVVYSGKNEYFQDSNIVWINHDDNITNSFLKHFYNIIEWSGIEGSTIKRLYNDNILNTTIAFTNLDEQNAISSFLDLCDTRILSSENALQQLLCLKNTLIGEMFI